MDRAKADEKNPEKGPPQGLASWGVFFAQRGRLGAKFADALRL
jgi:hypothetical protein